jgi:hypothetical protein
MSNADQPGKVWDPAYKSWINPVVSGWILAEFPGVLENHGWFHWSMVVGDDMVCHCGERLPPAAGRAVPRLLLHVADKIAEVLVAEERVRAMALKAWAAEWVGAGKVEWFDEKGMRIEWDDVPIRMRRLDE